MHSGWRRPSREAELGNKKGGAGRTADAPPESREGSLTLSVACPCPSPWACPVVSAVLAVGAVVAVAAPPVVGAAVAAVAPAVVDAVAAAGAPLVAAAAPAAAVDAVAAAGALLVADVALAAAVDAGVAASLAAVPAVGLRWVAPVARTVAGRCAHSPAVRCSTAGSVARWEEVDWSDRSPVVGRAARSLVRWAVPHWEADWAAH